MFFRWLKRYMPRGLYGRAALILILPVLTLTILVSLVFIQRHFDGVTRQMARSVSIELQFLRNTADEAATPAAARRTVSAIAEPLQLSVNWPDRVPPLGDDRPLVDFTGGMVTRHLSERVPEIAEISLANRRMVTVWIETRHGPMEVTFRRQQISASNPHQLLVIMIAMAALMTTISYFFLRNQLRPIKRMAAAAQAYGKGRMAHFSPSGALEVRAAGTAFLEMRNRIERQTQARTMMLSGVSHDLKTPLTRMRLGLSMLDEDDAAPLMQDVDEMQHLLDAFLDFARSDAEDVLEAVDPHALLATAAEDARRGGQTVEMRDGTGPRDAVLLRPMAVRRALGNLIGNALRYGSRARVATHVTTKAVRYVVEDDGPGIPPGQREEALRPFVRLDPARNQNKGSGVGLGLAIVVDVARSHGGSVRLGESDALGGLKVELVLPK